MKFDELYHLLFNYYGDPNWWPGDSRFEIILGAILTQQTNWKNVEKALTNLKEAGILSAEDGPSIFRLLETDEDELKRLIHPSGFYNQKARRLRETARFFKEAVNGDLDRFEGWETRILRTKLLALKGIGNETADSILLYALERPVFVIDAYTFRILERLGIYRDQRKDYLALQSQFHGSLDRNLPLFQRYHGLLVVHAKDFCRSRPLCETCPIKLSCDSFSGR